MKSDLEEVKTKKSEVKKSGADEYDVKKSSRRKKK